MNWRYVYIGSVAVLSYVLFLSWNAEKEIKQEFAEATFIERNNSEKLLPPGESNDFIQIQNDKLEVLVSPFLWKDLASKIKRTHIFKQRRVSGCAVVWF
jgi:hypothetical protein